MLSELQAGVAVLFAASAVDAARRRDHARSVIAEYGLDARLEPMIPLPPANKRRREAYERVLSGLMEVSAEPEPQRTRDIEWLLQRFA